MLCIGLGLCYLAVRTERIFLIHGGVLTAIGIAIVLNTHEDDIEPIKNQSDK